MRKRNLVTSAKNELIFWGGRNENETAVHSRLVDYWQKGAGWDWITLDNIEEFDSKYAWSAAFISYIARKDYFNFPASATHANYTVWARERANQGHTAQIAVETHSYKPRPGDIVIKKRGYTGDLAGLYPTAKTHGDIVVENNGNYITVIGGNISNSVTETIIPATNGFINHSDWIAVIKM
ncbi:DUF2272 domain-containing protein [Brumimicrobium aurantiacum]|nr:DUF2272 domain-containing protein [Brumimicrobium aurantiacum]